MTKTGWARSPFVGGVIGVFAGGLTIFLMEALGHALFGTADPADLSSVTIVMWGSVLAAWIVGSAVAGAAATLWARSTSLVLGVVVGLVLLAAAVSNMFVIPHPVWMMVAAVLLMPAAAITAARYSARSVGA